MILLNKKCWKVIKRKFFKEILILRYGLSNNDELTQKDVADLLGISQSYISRLEKKIIKKLRSQLNYDEVK